MTGRVVAGLVAAAAPAVRIVVAGPRP